ncbi:MAG TPA: AAA family ATPase [Streptosporangiaceae bacterium]|nr:AAA family ATPase [Streptosporangiaceae bacterium]
MPQPRRSSVLDRGQEMRALCGVLDRTGGDSCGIGLIEGPVGIGKTTLLQELSAAARGRGFRILSARCGPTERDFGFGVARQLVESALHRASDEQRSAWLEGPSVLANGVLTVSVGPVADQLFRAQVTHACCRLVLNMAREQPVLVAVDDVHWADEASVSWLSYLCRRLSGESVAVALALNPAELTGGPSPVTEISSAHGCVHAHPRPLSTESVSLLAAEMLGATPPPQFLATCQAATGGNPLLLRALLRDLEWRGTSPAEYAAADPGPSGLGEFDRAVSRILSRQPQETRLCLEALAAAGPASVPDLSALVGLDESAAGRIITQLTDIGMVQPGQPARFCHPWIQRAVLTAAAPDRLSMLHASAARMLHSKRANEEEVASHLLATVAGRSTWAVGVLRAAGRRALRRGAAHTAADCFERALAERVPDPPMGAMLAELGMAEFQLSHAMCIGHLTEALTLLGSGDERMAAAATLADALTAEGRPADARELLKAEIDAADPGVPDQAHAALRLRVQLLLEIRDRAEDPAELATELEVFRSHMGSAEPHSIGNRCLHAFEALLAAEAGHDLRDVAISARRALAGPLPGDRTGLAISTAAVALIWAGYGDEADSWCRAIRAEVPGDGAAASQAVASFGMAEVALCRGDLAAAVDHGRRTLDLLPIHCWKSFAALPVATTVRALVELGRLEEATELATRPLAGQPLSTRYESHLSAARGRLMLSLGRPERAVAEFLACEEGLRRWQRDSPALLSWRPDAAEAFLALGDAGQARRLVEEELRLARRTGMARAVAVGLRCVGSLPWETAGVRKVEESVRLLERTTARLELARALVAAGSARGRLGHDRLARDWLSRGMDVATACGAAPLAEQARTLLIRHGGRRRAASGMGVAALTESERRVARLAADGLKNREIARGLFITQRTVENHLTSAFRKLGISGRAQLAALLCPAGNEPEAAG